MRELRAQAQVETIAIIFCWFEVFFAPRDWNCIILFISCLFVICWSNEIYKIDDDFCFFFFVFEGDPVNA